MKNNCSCFYSNFATEAQATIATTVAVSNKEKVIQLINNVQIKCTTVIVNKWVLLMPGWKVTATDKCTTYVIKTNHMIETIRPLDTSKIIGIQPHS